VQINERIRKLEVTAPIRAVYVLFLNESESIESAMLRESVSNRDYQIISVEFV
jgi:hypothetical protein